MTSDLHARLTDAARTAMEIIRRERGGDLRGIVDLVGTYDEGDKGLVMGALASVVTTRSPSSMSSPSRTAS